MAIDQAADHFAAGKEEALSWLTKEISGLRSGRVKPDLVTSVTVEHYGTRNPLQSLASVSSLDARTLLISPWDRSAIAAIEKALTEANLGVMPTVDGQNIRLSFPSLTQEGRETTIKQLHKKAEETRVKLRVSRDESLKTIKKDKENGDVSEDDFYAGKEELDKLIDEANTEIASIIEKKEKEITTL